MNEKTLALQLLALGVSMLTNAPVVETKVKVAAPKPAPRKVAVNRPAPAPVAPKHEFNREPDGVQIVVDRPRIENYGSRQKWAEDMANYRCLIDQAKKCEWNTRVPEHIPAHVHANRRDWYEDNEPQTVKPHMMGFGCPQCSGWGW